MLLCHRTTDVDACNLPTGASKDLNHLVTRKGPAVAGERPNCNDVGLRTLTGIKTKRITSTRKHLSVAGERSRIVPSVDYYCEERRAGQEAGLSVPSPCQVPAGEVTGSMQCVRSARSGCQVPAGQVLPPLCRSCCQSQGTARGSRARVEAEDDWFVPSQRSLPLGNDVGVLPCVGDVVPGCKVPAAQAQVSAGHSRHQPTSKLVQMPDDNRQCHEHSRCWGLCAEFFEDIRKLGNVTCIHCLQVRAVQSVVNRIDCETCRGLTLPWIQDSRTIAKLNRPGQGCAEAQGKVAPRELQCTQASAGYRSGKARPRVV